VTSFQVNPASKTDLIAELDRVVTEMARLANLARADGA
jgi:hypothetical protein